MLAYGARSVHVRRLTRRRRGRVLGPPVGVLGVAHGMVPRSVRSSLAAHRTPASSCQHQGGGIAVVALTSPARVWHLAAPRVRIAECGTLTWRTAARFPSTATLEPRHRRPPTAGPWRGPPSRNRSARVRPEGRVRGRARRRPGAGRAARLRRRRRSRRPAARRALHRPGRPGRGPSGTGRRRGPASGPGPLGDQGARGALHDRRRGPGHPGRRRRRGHWRHRARAQPDPARDGAWRQRRDGQQGAARRRRPDPLCSGGRPRRRPLLRGRGRRRDPVAPPTARVARRRLGTPRAGHRQRHHQLRARQDGHDRSRLRRGSRAGAGAGLRRGRSDGRRRGLRRRREGRDPGLARLPHPGRRGRRPSRGHHRGHQRRRGGGPGHGLRRQAARHLRAGRPAGLERPALGQKGFRSGSTRR